MPQASRLVVLTTVATVALALLSAAPGHGAEGDARKAGVGSRGRPLPEVRSFVITEVGGWWMIDEDPVSGGNDFAVSCDLGWMRNLDEKNALGWTVFSEVGGFARLGVRARYRRWIGRAASIDLSPGLVLTNKDDSGADLHPPMPVASLVLNAGDITSLGLEVQRGRFEHWDVAANRRVEFWDTNWRLGARFGSTPGAIGSALFVIAAVTYVQVMDWDG